jgi:hypothetical protein
MSATKHHAIQMQLVQIMTDISHALANLDSLETAHTVKTSMNAMTVHAIQMLHATTWLDHTLVLAT